MKFNSVAEELSQYLQDKNISIEELSEKSEISLMKLEGILHYGEPISYYLSAQLGLALNKKENYWVKKKQSYDV